jgi:hypothetical protein
MNKKMIWIMVIGGVVGGIGGYFYYKFYGCTAGCMITSNPWRSTIYGIILGLMAANVFTKG